MKSLRVWLLTLVTLGWLSILPVGAAAAAASRDDDERHFEALKVGELAFTNVWVHRQTNFNTLIRHSGGIHTIKLTDLPAKDLAELKSQIGDLAAMDKPTGNTPAIGLLEKIKAALKNASPQTLAIVGAAAVLMIGLIIVIRRRNRGDPPA